MPIDAGIYGQFAEPARSTADYQAQYDSQAQRQMQLQQNRLALMQAQQLDKERSGLRDAVQSGQVNLQDPNHLARLQAMFPTAGPAFVAGIDKSAQARASAYMDTGKGDEARSLSKKNDAQTARDDYTSAATAVLANPTLDAARRAVMQMAVKYNGDPMAELQQLAQIGDSPDGIKQWAAGHALQAKELLPTTSNTDNGGTRLFNSTNPVTGAVTLTGSVPITQSANNAATVAGEDRRAAATRAQTLELANRGQIKETDAGLVVVDPRTGAAKPVMDPTTGAPLGPKLKDIPASVNTAIITNNQALNQLDRAIQLAQGNDVGAQKGDKSATGFKGFLPQTALNYIDPQGVDTRAEIADIGSLKLHDRSGAAVTASESPRLMPFIPSATDSNETALKKLKRLRMEVANESTALSDTYSKNQGYKPSPVKPSMPSPIQPGGIPSAADIEAAIKRKLGGK